MNFNFIKLKKRNTIDQITVSQNDFIIFTKLAIKNLNNPKYIEIEIDEINKAIKIINSNEILGRKVQYRPNTSTYVQVRNISQKIPCGVYKIVDTINHIYIFDKKYIKYNKIS